MAPARPAVRPAYTVTDAQIRGDYRYVLDRRWRECVRTGRVMGWIGLNPSTADGMTDDQTIRRMCDYAWREDFDGICVLNAFALRATDPEELARHGDPVGPHNDRWLTGLAEQAASGAVVVAAWGAHRFAAARIARVREIFGDAPLWCLGTTADGSPRHPSRLRADAPLVRYRWGEI